MDSFETHDPTRGFAEFATMAAARADFDDRIQSYCDGRWSIDTPPVDVRLSVLVAVATVRWNGEHNGTAEIVSHEDAATVAAIQRYLRAKRDAARRQFGRDGLDVINWLCAEAEDDAER